jgi:hypothetical protein
MNALLAVFREGANQCPETARSGNSLYGVEK